MNCLDCRRATLVDPHDPDPSRLAHLAECVRCEEYAQSILKQDELIREATQIELPDGFAARILLNQSLQQQSRRPTRWYWLSLAASLLLAVALVPQLFNPGEDLDASLVGHIHKHSLDVSDGRFSDQADIHQVFASAQAEVPEDSSHILYATTCVIDGIVMAHLLVKDEDSQYVMFVIPEKQLAARAFSVNEWSGQMVKAGDSHSIALLNQSGAGLQPAARRMAANFTTGQTI